MYLLDENRIEFDSSDWIPMVDWFTPAYYFDIAWLSSAYEGASFVLVEFKSASGDVIFS